MSDDDSRPSSCRPAAGLLDELESIKGALAGGRNVDAALPADIPLLDDMVIPNLDRNAQLLNIGQIFDDAATEDDDEEPATPEQPMQFPRFTLDVAISDHGEIPPQSPPEVPPSKLPVSTPAVSSSSTRVRPDYNREVLIQELVDEFVPQIEAELHKRLRHLDEAALRRLLKESK